MPAVLVFLSQAMIEARSGTSLMSTTRGALLAACIGGLSVGAVIVGPGSVPSSAPMVAVLVAAALCSFRQTVGFAVVRLVASVAVTSFVSARRGSAVWRGVVFQVSLTTRGVFVSWKRLQ